MLVEFEFLSLVINNDAHGRSERLINTLQMRNRFFIAFAGGLIACLTFAACQTDSTNSASSTAPSLSSPTPTNPSLAGLIRNVSIYPVPNNRKDLAITMVVSLKNEGSTTTAKDWTLEVSGPGQSLPSGLSAVQVSGVVDLPGSQTGKVDLVKDDLVKKSANMPLSQGYQMDGVLTFIMPDTTDKELANRGVQLTVHFQDATGKLYQTPKSIVGQSK
jgi:hypothetical protein